MTCPKCGAALEEGRLFCEKCGYEIRLVPDYDPLESVVIGEESLDNSIEDNEYDTKAGKKDLGLDSGSARAKRGAGTGLKIILILAALCVCLAVTIVSYVSVSRDNSYSWQKSKGISLFEDGEYEEALKYLKKSMELQTSMEGADIQPLWYMSYAYAYTGAKELAVSCMQEAIAAENAARRDNYNLESLYVDLMDILNITGQTYLIDEVIEECEYQEICLTLEDYRIEKPTCDTAEGTYSYYLRLILSAEYGSVYYTLDGTEPTRESTKYESPIELTEEGETLLTAVAINKKGMISDKLVLVYKIEFRTDKDDGAMNNKEEIHKW